MARPCAAPLLPALLALCTPWPAAGGAGIAELRALGADPTAVVDGLQKTGSSILARAESAAASANAAANRVQYMAVQSELKTTKLKDLLAGATAAGDGAVRQEQAARLVEQQLEQKTFAKAAEEKAAHLAVEAVEAMFAAKYRALEPWSREVLTDPHEEAEMETKRAVLPYDSKLMTAYARLGEYGAEATALRAHSRKLLTKAGELEGAAEEMTEANPAGAKQDFADARRLRAEGQRLAAEAREAQASAADVEDSVSRTLKKRQAAALRATRKANPESLPPLRMDPETAYLPPPPPGAVAAPQGVLLAPPA